MENLENCRNLLVIRLDNMGDIIMNNAAFSSLKEIMPTCKITLLTSSIAAPIVPYLGTIDESIIFDVPWMKSTYSASNQECYSIIEKLKSRQFDGCIIFNVYSQNIFPAAMIAYLAAIPLRAGYARENPYQLLTHWIVDPEPLREIHHQIKRDLLLLKHLGLPIDIKRLPTLLKTPPHLTTHIKEPSDKIGSFLIINLDVSETKRQLPISKANLIIKKCLEAGHTIVFTGKHDSPYLQSCIQGLTHPRFHNLVQNTTIEQLIYLVRKSSAIITLNTGLSHIACAYRQPVLVLYANTNPQHGPWTENSIQLNFEIPNELKSKNEIVRYVDNHYACRGTAVSKADTLFLEDFQSGLHKLITFSNTASI